ncbi:KpsF/GutQ family sugar-phosphate isomerase [Phaeovibrio sulfidiphilus]|uniref:KpsF/GutQ family sugar-phosphate isomerase n=1 Tax=Phaeovibrio sulfidiphilus TaxID=1220600 RepID=A0A8J6YXZ0_9PROT|nr:KpsF/GutQ family sugar-phosphate isomerase [Phaeovibrio sulfidiphilus]MBE1236608.1 KpsF/GutQ family sugar-phosphate isomerase [Phaeovibrio sulfidiphilus]
MTAPTSARAASPARHPVQDQTLATARRVLETEKQALGALSDSLNGVLCDVIERLLALKGKVIISGMGKSGHVGRKIAATMASTGTPAFFVHPGEASHGDLGMIGPEDGVIALSNSGETPELADLTAYTRRNGNLLVSITGRDPSTLSTAADLALVLPPLTEACPNGLAPTTSTTLMIALGDALAVSLLERRGFTATDFRNFHPGGKLGTILKRVSDLMHPKDSLPLVSMDTPMGQAILEISAKSLGCTGVVDGDGRLAGIITDGDLRRHMDKDLLGRKTADVMTRAPLTVRPSLMAVEALRIMNEHKITGLFALDEDRRPVGFVHLHDCLRAGIA